MIRLVDELERRIYEYAEREVDYYISRNDFANRIERVKKKEKIILQINKKIVTQLFNIGMKD